jgi:transposase-like protein
MKKSRHGEEKVIAAVKQMEGGRKTADVARELGVSATTLYAWKVRYATGWGSFRHSCGSRNEEGIDAVRHRLTPRSGATPRTRLVPHGCPPWAINFRPSGLAAAREMRGITRP